MGAIEFRPNGPRSYALLIGGREIATVEREPRGKDWSFRNDALGVYSSGHRSRNAAVLAALTVPRLKAMIL